MTLEIILPPPAACDRNHGKAGIAAAGANKQARLIAKVRTLEAMRAQGAENFARLSCDRYNRYMVHLLVLDGSGLMDLDNAVATFKHYQDGIFDALRLNDRCVTALHAEVERGRGKHIHRWYRCLVTDDLTEFDRACVNENVAIGALVARAEAETQKGDAR